VFSALVHFSFLFIAVEVIEISLISLSNLVASFFGVSSSFLLNRHYVFRTVRKSFYTAYFHFIVANTVTISLTSFLFLGWSDWLGWDYKVGFLLIYILVAMLNYVLYKKVIFN